MAINNLAENISIYYDNLSWYLVVTILVTGVCTLLTLCLQFQIPVIEAIEKMFPFAFTSLVSTKSQTSDLADSSKIQNLLAESLRENSEEVLNTYGLDEDLDIMHSVNRKHIFNDVHNRMTPEQLVQEEEVVQQQLSKIYALMREQADKFNVHDMEDLEEQLTLYKK
uniref:Putative conserved protein with signal anchor panstrongylus lignarius n=1 Tax=Xenopsylla cheopis TaxID=163159 RepID=A0A6M2DJ23_XENCH